ncbi:hypothetical protein RGQ29_006830 [Quercus rubra]|uniref:RING-type E3 ubiquitin transferase n=1 Tax=Quercus rubra TaxID=3512 RepID=A0AAN7E8S9_QUERU|nr:hypothetical protein RGQ29_006830 [Quercus rubra]
MSLLRNHSVIDHTNFLVWQQSQPSSNPQPPSQTTMLNVFPIKFQLRSLRKVEFYEGDSPEPHASFENTFRKRVSAWLSEEDKVLLRDNGDRFCLYHNLGIPETYHCPVLQKIESVAASARGSRMPIVVDLMHTVKRVIRIPTNHDLVFSSDEDEADVDTVLLHSIETYEPKPIPAAKSSIRALEKVRFQGGSNSIQQCTICMEEFRISSEVTRMPCSHIYHEKCIFKWLKTSHLCPLCRYPMPQDS